MPNSARSARCFPKPTAGSAARASTSPWCSNASGAAVVEPFLGALLAGHALSLAGGAAHRDRLAALIDGSASAAFAHDEPGSHYELTTVRTRAERSGDGWVLTGAKGVVEAAQAAFFVVSARVSGHDDDAAGIGLFVVPADAPGVSLRDYPKIDGGRAAEVRFERVALPADAALGAHDGEAGAELLERVLGYGLLALSAEALGAMDVAKEYTLDYLRTRKQFGLPIGSFQALQHRMADLLLEVEQARSAVINAAAQLDAPRVVRERARGGEVHDRPDRHARCRGEHPAARRDRDDVGAAAVALREAPRDDRSPARRRGSSPRALHRAVETVKTNDANGGTRMTNESRALPLAGVKVLDFRVCSRVVRDGARRFRRGSDQVEHPARGDDTRDWGLRIGDTETTYFNSVNRSKRSICLDLQTEAGQRLARELAAQADVVLHNFARRRGKLGLGYDALAELNPRLVHCAISGYDRSGAEAARPGYDLVVQGEAGLMALNGEAGQPPLKFGVAAVDLFTGMYSAQAILAALYERHATGAGGASKWRCSTAG